uniref:VWFA domain-containing protein n=1 Tax=Meloidogyne incognita TaxID=6306 RepID=A0A914NCZ0_MELIC
MTTMIRCISMILYKHSMKSAPPLLLAILLSFLIFGTKTTVNAQQLPRGDTIFPVSCYLNVMIILDRSDSVLGGFNRSRDFVLAASEELNIGPHAHSVSMITYSGNHYRREIYPWNFAKNNEVK